MSVQAYLRRTWRQLPFTDKDPFDVRINDSLDELSIQIDLLKAELKHIKQDYEAIDEESLPETDQKRRLVYQKFSDKKHTAEEEILNLVTLTYVKNLIFNVDSTSQSNSISMSSLICDDNEIHEEIIEKVRAELDVSHLRNILTLTLPNEDAINEVQCSYPWEPESCSAVCSSLQPELPTQEMTRLLIQVLGEEVSSYLYYNRSYMEISQDGNSDFSYISEYEISD